VIGGDGGLTDLADDTDEGFPVVTDVKAHHAGIQATRRVPRIKSAWCLLNPCMEKELWVDPCPPGEKSEINGPTPPHGALCTPTPQRVRSSF